ncbi:restriction endonuclease [Caulobacter sp. UC70_42]|uniref:restriction endonuclease n=1 Tax=Caulobacter sp. UC70_42 TaxID=3374551 RepID=UPI00375658AD
MDKRQGIPFQNFVGVITKTFGGQPGVTVEVGKLVPDKTTGRVRDFDIVITSKVGPHTMTTAIECKDKGRPIDTPAIEAFSKKCERHGFTTKVMVSSSGFTKTAQEVAKDERVTLMTLKEAEGFKWLATPTISKRWRKFEPLNIGFNIRPDDVPKVVMPFTAYDEDGEAITYEQFQVSIEAALPSYIVLPEGMQTEHILIEGPFTLIDATGAKFAAADAMCVASYEWQETQIQWETHEYSGDGARFEVASVNANVFGSESRIVLRTQEDGQLGVFFVGDGKAEWVPSEVADPAAIPQLMKPSDP